MVMGFKRGFFLKSNTNNMLSVKLNVWLNKGNTVEKARVFRKKPTKRKTIFKIGAVMFQNFYFLIFCLVAVISTEKKM